MTLSLNAYDDQNIFARILRKEIPAKVVYEDDVALAFHDVAPAGPVHVLVIPKTPVTCLTSFLEKSEIDIAAFWKAVQKTIETLALEPGGFRIIINQGGHGGQEVPHLHVHILGGENIGALRAPKA